MPCLPFSRSSARSESRGSKHKLFSWSVFSHNSSEHNYNRASKSAPSSSVQLQQASTSNSQTDPGFVDLRQDAEGDLQLSHNDNPPLTQTSIPHVSSELRVFTFVELRAVTQNFSRSNLIGEGGFGCVYRGFLKPENSKPPKEVAVKLLNRFGQQGHKEWLAEVRFLGLVEHPNLVKLVGYCAEQDERGIQRLLVYEYMARRSIEGYLFGKELPVLSWQQRINIILGAAQGLAYLHEGIDGIQVIFRDFKTSNVLLDKDFTPKLSDFGLAREGPEMGASHVSTSVVGTLGYAAPEYVQTGHLTAKSDVWSFGVVLFEMLSGRRSVDRNRPRHEQHLLEWVRPYIYGNKKIPAIMDPRLQGDYSLKQAQKLVELAIQCCSRIPKARPSMSHVVRKLNGIMALLPVEDSPINAHASGSGARDSSFQSKQGLIVDMRNRVWGPKAVHA